MTLSRNDFVKLRAEIATSTISDDQKRAWLKLLTLLEERPERHERTMEMFDRHEREMVHFLCLSVSILLVSILLVLAAWMWGPL